jgi:hypothetical protein
MTTLSLHRTRAADVVAEIGPLLVSDLPAGLPAQPSWFARVRNEVVARRQARSFERALRHAGPGELGDLLAAHRHA